jgi:hypothetical protein
MTIDTAGSTPVQPVAPAAPAKSTWQRIIGVFFSPGETFEDIVRRPDILWPLIILTLVGFITTVLVMPHLDFDAVVAQQTEMMQKQGKQMSDADVERMGRITKAMAKVAGYIGPLFIIVGYLLIALVLWGAFRLMGGEGDFKQSLSTTLYSFFPRMVLGGIIGTVVIMMRGMVDPTQAASVMMTNPAFLVDMKAQPILFALLTSLDIFMLWTIVLLTIGFSKVSRLSKGKSAAIIVSLWIVTVAIKLGFAAMSAARMKG